MPRKRRTPTRPLRAGTLLKKVYDAVAEYPGIPITTSEVALECGIKSAKASPYLRELRDRGLIQSTQRGRGYQDHYWTGELCRLFIHERSSDV